MKLPYHICIFKQTPYLQVAINSIYIYLCSNDFIFLLEKRIYTNFLCFIDLIIMFNFDIQ